MVAATNKNKAEEDNKPVFKTFTPTADWVAIRVHRMDKTSGGIELPDGVRDPLQSPTGTVIAAGPDCKQVKEGDVVVASGQTPGYNIICGGSGKVMMAKECELAGVVLPEFANTK